MQAAQRAPPSESSRSGIPAEPTALLGPEPSRALHRFGASASLQQTQSAQCLRNEPHILWMWPSAGACCLKHCARAASFAFEVFERSSFERRQNRHLPRVVPWIGILSCEIALEPTGDYHPPRANVLLRNPNHMHFVSSLATSRAREILYRQKKETSASVGCYCNVTTVMLHGGKVIENDVPTPEGTLLFVDAPTQTLFFV